MTSGEVATTAAAIPSSQTSAQASQSDEPALTDRLFSEQVRASAASYPTSAAGMLIWGGIAALVMHYSQALGAVPWHRGLFAFSAVMVSAGISVWMSRAYFKMAAPDQHRWYKIFLANQFLSGVTWSCVSILMWVPQNLVNNLFLQIMLFGYLFTGVVQYSNLRSHFAITATLPFATVLALFVWYPTEISVLIYWLSAPFLLWLLLICQQLNGKFRHHIMLQVSYEGLNTEVIEARDEAISANRAKSIFLATMSHELRTPLNAIIGFSELLLKTRLDRVSEAQNRDFLTNIHDSGHHLLAIINDVLDLAKIESGKLELNCDTLDLPDTMQASLRLLAGRISAEGFEVSVSGGDLIDPIQADERATHQIFFNLLSNAIKYSPDEKKIDIIYYQDTDCVYVDISDKGSGIPVDVQGDLFTPFHRADNSYGGAQEGTGLGLSMVKALMDMHDGSVNLTSAAGEGTTVTLAWQRAACCQCEV